MDKQKMKEIATKYQNYFLYLFNISFKDHLYADIVSLFNDAINDCNVFNDEDMTILVSPSSNDNIEQIVNAIIDDTGVTLKVYKSNLLTNPNEIDIVIDMYRKYQTKINQSYISNRMLIEEMFNNDINDLELFKPIVVGKILNDNKLFEIVNGMFINNLNVCKTAAYVYMHRNTINNKLNIIKEETGLDIQNFQDAVMLYVLIKK